MKAILIFTILLLPLLHNAQILVDVSTQNDIDIGFGIGNEGGGISFVDFNGDGWDDLTFASQQGDSIHIYQNNNGILSKISTPSIFSDCESKQILWADYDRDGDQDLYITCHENQNRLYQNDGNFNFTDVTSSVNLPATNDPSFGAAFGDYNLDGWLDLYVCNYHNDVFTNRLYKNNAGTFSDETAAAQVDTGPNFSFAATFFDYNNDGWPDIYVAIDKYFNNLLFKNKGDGTFEDVSISSGAGIVIDAMNSGVGDVDNDGDLDIYVTNTEGGNALLINNGDGSFTESAASCGVELNKISWAGNFFDFDNDMDMDLYVSTHYFPGANHQLYINEGSCNFTAYSGNYSGNADQGYSHACGDFNQDGEIDLALSQGIGFDFMLLENDGGYSNNWIKIKLQGTESNKDGIGSWIEVWVNGQKQVRYTTAGTGYLNQNSMVQHFGIGTATSIDSIIVRWPLGIVNKLLPPEIGGINHFLGIVETQAPLAVEWFGFNVFPTDKQSIRLNWVTSTEEDNEGFEIQRSEDAIRFEKIGWLNNSQSTSSTSAYTFEDFDVQTGITYYYRVKQIDFDGSFNISNVQSTAIPNHEHIPGFSIYPNPINNGLANLHIYSATQAISLFELYNINGQLITETELLLEKGENTEVIECHYLSSGIYITKLEIDNQIYFRRFIIR